MLTDFDDIENGSGDEEGEELSAAEVLERLEQVKLI